MALQGTLESFGISEIFQLVSQQGKTGTLEIETGDGLARIRFLDGRLVEAWPDKRSPSELIGALLVRAGVVNETQLEHALMVQRESLRPLGDILIRIGAVRVAEFQEVLSLQHRETVYRLLRLRRGRFFFRPEPVEAEEGVSALLDVGTLLMEGFRQIDEWPKLLEEVPGDGRVCLRTDEPASPDLSRDQVRVLGLIDGVSTVRQIVDRARLGEFAARVALRSLLAAGLAVPADVVRNVAPVPRAPRRAAAPILDVGLAVVLLAAALLSLGVTGAGVQAAKLAAAATAAREEARGLQARARAWGETEPRVWPSATRLPVARMAPVSAAPLPEVPLWPEPEGEGGQP
ncbi:MAG: DUF4388 domain-containing protein [Deltaproteobacteria bacterium]|nr:DUF4388 domain-containing protein [Deltaproteobacteria bacterium]